MTAALRDAQFQLLLDVLEQVDGTAPTLCEGWDAQELAIHLWQLHRDPIAWIGTSVRASGGITKRRAAETRARWSYAELLGRLRELPAAIPCMPDDRFEACRHALGEYWIHTQDVARPNGVEQPEPSFELECALWKRASVAGLALHALRTPGLVIAWPGVSARQITPGRTPRVRVEGRPGEVMLWLYGRTSAADVRVVDASEPLLV